jgi:sporulation protein YabP
MEKADTAHMITLTARRDLSVSGVKKVDTFDDRTVVLVTSAGVLTVKGENLHIKHLDLDEGNLVLDGRIGQLVYSDSARERRAGLLERLVR